MRFFTYFLIALTILFAEWVAAKGIWSLVLPWYIKIPALVIEILLHGVFLAAIASVADRKGD